MRSVEPAGHHPSSHPWPLLLFGTVLIAILSLSIHVAMLQALGIAHPDFSSVGIWGLLLVVGQTFATITLYALVRDDLARLALIARALLVACAYTVATDQVRLSVMAAVATASPTFPAIDLAFEFVTNLILALIIVGVSPLMRGWATRLAGALAITAASAFLLQPRLGAIEARYAHLARPEIYVEPYGIGVLSVSYTLFAGTVAAVIAILWLVAPRLSRRPVRNCIQATVLVLLLRGMLIAQLLFPWLMPQGGGSAALEISQFFLQDLAMSIMAWTLWYIVTRRRWLTPAAD